MRYQNMVKAEELSIEADISDSIKMLTELGAKEKRTLKKVLSAVGTDAKNKAKKAYKSSGLKKGTGELNKSIIRKVLKDGKEVLISAKARNDRNIFYGYALAKGSTIRAKNAENLKFQIDGKWVTKQEVRLKEHDFIVSPVKAYLSSTAFQERLDKFVQKEIDRIEKESVKMKTEMQVLEHLSALIPEGIKPYLTDDKVSSDFSALNVVIDFPDPDNMRKDNMLYLVPEYENIEELTTSSDTALFEVKLYIVSKKGTSSALIKRVFDLYTAFYLFMRNNPTLDGFIDLSRITDMDYYPSIAPSGASTAIEVTMFLSWEKVY